MPIAPSFRILPTLLAVALLGAALAQGDLRARLLAMLPDSAQSAQVLEYTQDPEYAALQERVDFAMRQDPLWFRDYLAQYQGQSRIPYNPKFGVNEREYLRYIGDCCRGVRLTKNGKAVRLSISRSGNKVTFQGGGGADGLRGLTLDIVTGELRVPEGFSARPHPIIANDNALGLQPRKGWGWQITNSKASSRMSMWAGFSLLQFQNGTVLLSYHRQTSVGGQLQPELDLNVLYEKKNTPAARTSGIK